MAHPGNVKLLVFVLGAPGAGKGTQCELIKEKYGWSHISAGDLLRAEVAQKTTRGLEIDEYIKQGTMVPGSWIIDLLRDAMAKDGVSKVLIDGFPREVSQLWQFQEEVMHCNKALFFNVPEEVARERLQLRSATSGRVDDNDETIRNRFVVFRQESMPVIDKLAELGRVAEIDASGSPDEVFAAASLVIEQLEQQLSLEPVAEAAASVEAAVTPSLDVPAETSSAEAVVVQPSAAAAEEVAAAAGAAPSAEASEAAPAGGAAALEDAAATAVEPAFAEPAAAGEVAGATAAAAGALAAAAMGASAAAALAAGSEAQTVPAAEPADTPAAAASLEAPAVVTAASPEGPAIPEAAAVAAASAAPNVMSLHMDLSGMRMPIVICGPSGVGKGTLISKLMQLYPNRFGFSVSHTTRAPRPGEAHGVHYYFTSHEAMQPQVDAGMFLEHALVHGNMYGTSLAAVARVSAEGKHCVLDIDVQGAQQVRRSSLGEHCLFIFIAPPSHDELERRLRNRGTESEDKVQQRLANAESEIAKAQEPGLFHHILVNGDLEAAFNQLQQLIEQRVPGLLQLSSTPAPQPAAATAAEQVPAAVEGSDAEANQTVAAGAAATAAAGIAAAGVAAAAAAGQPAAAKQHVPLANGNATQLPAPAVPSAPTATVVVGGGNGTSTLLDFGFGAAAGPAVAVKGMPVRQYMDVTVIPVLREGLKALNVARPDDPLQYLADFLVAHKPAVQ